MKKNFDQVTDQRLNELAVEYVGGNIEAGDEFFQVIDKKLESFSYRKHTNKLGTTREDLFQDFRVIAFEMMEKFVDRYNDGTNNILGLIYTKCDQFVKDLYKSENKTQKRSLYKDREVSLQSLVGEDGDMSLSEKVSVDSKSVEDIVSDKLNADALNQIVSSFASQTKGRNGKIVPLIYKANVEDWDSEDLNNEIAIVLEAETGKAPKADAIRQAKSRAMKALKKSIEDGMVFANQLEWEL